MEKEERLNKQTFKVDIVLLKVLPILMAGLYFLNTLLSYFNLDYQIISYLTGIGFIPLLYLYRCSFLFKFCVYHRMPLYYIIVNDTICWIDANYEIPVNNLEYLCIHTTAAFICLCLALFLKFKICRH